MAEIFSFNLNLLELLFYDFEWEIFNYQINSQNINFIKMSSQKSLLNTMNTWTQLIEPNRSRKFRSPKLESHSPVWQHMFGSTCFQNAVFMYFSEKYRSNAIQFFPNYSNIIKLSKNVRWLLEKNTIPIFLVVWGDVIETKSIHQLKAQNKHTRCICVQCISKFLTLLYWLATVGRYLTTR